MLKKISKHGWRTIQFALESWARTARLAVLLMLVISLPTLTVVFGIR